MKAQAYIWYVEHFMIPLRRSRATFYEAITYDLLKILPSKVLALDEHLFLNYNSFLDKVTYNSLSPETWISSSINTYESNGSP